MDLLRTQKIRFLVDLYREMKRPDVNRQDRMALIDKVCDVLNNEEPSRDRDEVGSNFKLFIFLVFDSFDCYPFRIHSAVGRVAFARTKIADMSHEIEKFATIANASASVHGVHNRNVRSNN